MVGAPVKRLPAGAGSGRLGDGGVEQDLEAAEEHAFAVKKRGRV
jgi:hypothetical protein